ncbi:c-type cytochrome [Paenibacillus mendelii]|uniref:C-type cytochrome n=1 Tax=Paenibacillus mendelii TaxID=206163 RepID=A0ABV6J599_9BACL|nr:cytochrome c [Paenibacillus mendelii]MCQ6560230.1 cytochrome c [Paenibacillus mendelii]
MKVYSFFLSMIIVLVLTACSSEGNTQELEAGANSPGDVEAIALYKQSCLSCHAADLSGRVGPGLQEIGSKLSEEQLFGLIQDGARGMPSFKKKLTAAEIEALAQWLSNNK